MGPLELQAHGESMSMFRNRRREWAEMDLSDTTEKIVLITQIWDNEIRLRDDEPVTLIPDWVPPVYEDVLNAVKHPDQEFTEDNLKFLSAFGMRCMAIGVAAARYGWPLKEAEDGG